MQLGFGTNPNFVTALQRNSRTFAHISEQFIERGDKLKIRTFYETEKLYGQLVKPETFFMIVSLNLIRSDR
jgi:hypothetical protein